MCCPGAWLNPIAGHFFQLSPQLSACQIIGLKPFRRRTPARWIIRREI
jgi:hypothetical protein